MSTPGLFVGYAHTRAYIMRPILAGCTHILCRPALLALILQHAKRAAPDQTCVSATLLSFLPPGRHDLLRHAAAGDTSMFPIPLTRRATVVTLAAAVVALATPVLAQPATRVRATIVGVEGDRLTIRTKDDQELQVRLVEPATVRARVRTDPSAIKAGSFVGAAAVPGKNGALAGVEVVIFPEASRGAGEGRRPFDFLPESTMTNATVADEVVAADGTMLKLTYKGGTNPRPYSGDTRFHG